MTEDTAVAIVESELDNAETEPTAPEPTKAEIRAAEKAEKLADLRSNEAIISKGAKAVRTSLPLMAEALTNIRDNKLYKVATDPETGKGFKSFDRYLASHEEWGFSRQYASKLINDRKDALAIEAGEEPAQSAKREPKTLTDAEAAARVKRSFDTFGARAADYRDNPGTSEGFRKAFDTAWAASEAAIAKLVAKYPLPIEEAETEPEAETVA